MGIPSVTTGSSCRLEANIYSGRVMPSMLVSDLEELTGAYHHRSWSPTQATEFGSPNNVTFIILACWLASTWQRAQDARALSVPLSFKHSSTHDRKKRLVRFGPLTKPPVTTGNVCRAPRSTIVQAR